MGKELSRDFKGVWIPKELWLDENITKMEMLLLVEVDSLSQLDQGCFASNQHFADFLRVTKRRVQQLITSLSEKGYLMTKVTYDESGKRIIKRQIFIDHMKFSSWGWCKKFHEGSEKNYLDNNTTNNTNKNILSSDLDHVSEDIKKIVNYLNEVAGKNYKSSTKATQQHIKARLNEGYVFHDFKIVIDRKCRKWLGTQMEDYLRPETLFGSKFEGYLNESDNTYKKQEEDDGFRQPLITEDPQYIEMQRIREELRQIGVDA